MAGNVTSSPTRSNPVATIRSLAALIEPDHRARVYTTLLLAEDGELTPQEICDSIAVPRATIYDDLSWLVEEGLAARSETGRPHRYQATPQALSLSPWQTMGPRERTYYLALVVAVARKAENQTVETFIDRHGVETLADAIEYTLTRLKGQTTLRSMARELDLPVVETESIFQAIVGILSDLNQSHITPQSLDIPLDAADTGAE
ncbi:DUF7437 domain-containing protein [Halocatena pleomorpha]|nr:helix-turn-helix domain-containing protein [Halocatena pleomorpha]